MHTLPSRIQRWHSNDIDEQSTRLDGWRQEYQQLGRGRFVGQVSTVAGPHMSIMGERTNQSLHEYVAPPKDSVVFGLLLNGSHALQINRQPVGSASLIVLEGGREYEFRTEGPADLLGVSLDSAICRDKYSGNYEKEFERAIALGVVPLAHGSAGQLRQLWTKISELLQFGDTWPESLPLPSLAETVTNSLLVALGLSAGEDVPALPQSAGRQARVVQQAISFMHAHLARDFPMADVCAATHVSERTLQYYFEHCLGMSPRQYLKVMRLNAARRMLRRIGGHSRRCLPQLTIADIAAQCGYDHPSRFAGDYRQQFGMLPSDTARARAISATE